MLMCLRLTGETSQHPTALLFMNMLADEFDQVPAEDVVDPRPEVAQV